MGRPERLSTRRGRGRRPSAQGEGSYCKATPNEHNDMVSCMYRAKNLCQYGRTGDINHMQFRGVKCAARRRPRPLASAHPHTHAQVRFFQAQRWTDTGWHVVLWACVCVRSFSSTAPPWRSVYTHDWCGNQTWAQGNGGDCFSWCSIMDHYMNEVRSRVDGTHVIPALRQSERLRRLPLPSLPAPQTSSRHPKNELDGSSLATSALP